MRKVQLEGGILSHADLQNYSVKVGRALEGTYIDKKIYTTHAPTSGPGMSVWRLGIGHVRTHEVISSLAHAELDRKIRL